MDQVEEGLAAGIPLYAIEESLDYAENADRELTTNPQVRESSHHEGFLRRGLSLCLSLFGFRHALEPLTSPACGRGAGSQGR
jgi:hypothetical protein